MASLLNLVLGKSFPIFLKTKGLHSGDLLNQISAALGSSQSITATGVAQTDAAAVNTANVEILSGSVNNAGILLPLSYPGLIINVLNNSLNTSKIYPSGTEQIQLNGSGTAYAAAGVAVTMATLVSSSYICIKTGFWNRYITG